jgi:sterol desaturase/sphingolipid hydroxylase (fatty acid hydroxylase superfamily)
MGSIVPLFASMLVLVALERWRRTRWRALPLLRAGFATDLLLLLVGVVATAPISQEYVRRATALIHATPPSVGGAPRWLLVLPAIVLLDLGTYVGHVLLHRVGALWELHKVHHSSHSLDWLATFRFHPFEQVFRRLTAPLLLVLAGFPIEVVVAAAGFLMAWGMLNHANVRLRLGPLEWLLVTPRAHRVHHVVEHTERNLGTFLTVWDRLRGTFVDEEVSGAMGVPGELDYPQGLVSMLIEPFRRRYPGPALDRPR